MFKEFWKTIMSAINGNKKSKTDSAAAKADATTSSAKSAVVLVTNATFDSEVIASDKPVVVLFSAPWCSYCVKQAPVFEKVARQLSATVKFVKINTDNDKALKNRYGVRGIPNIGIHLPGAANGALILRPGFKEEAALKAFIKEATKA